MARAKAIFAVVRRVRGKNKGKIVKRYFRSEAERAKSLKRYQFERTRKSIKESIEASKKKVGGTLGTLKTF